MKREHFVKVAEEILDSLPEEFRIRIQNVAILVEDFPANQPPPKLGQRTGLLLRIFHGVPATKRRPLHILFLRILRLIISYSSIVNE